MKRSIEGQDRQQSTLLPEQLDEWVEADNRVRVADVLVDVLDLSSLGFKDAADTGKPPSSAPQFDKAKIRDRSLAAIVATLPRCR